LHEANLSHYVLVMWDYWRGLLNYSITELMLNA